MTETEQFREELLAMNEALVLGSLRQHELTEVAESLNVKLQSEITARKLAEEELLKAGALQKAIFDSANFSSIATDAKGVIQIFNVGAERMLGYTAAEVMNKITPADISDPQEVIARAKALSVELDTPIKPGFEALVFKASRGIEDIYELTYIRKDGSRFPALVSVTALRDAQEAIIGYLLIGTDNTARKLVEAEQKKLDQRLRDQQFYTRSLIESNIDALITTDPSGIITDVNKQMEALTGCTRDELIGAPFKSYFTDPERAEAAIKLVLSEKKVTDYELTACDRDGKQTVVSYNATTFYDRDRTLQGVFAAARDVTEHKRVETELQQANAAKSRFLAAASHDLRQPLQALTLLQGLLARTVEGERAQKLTARLGDTLVSMTGMLNSMLDINQIETGIVRAEMVSFPINDLLERLRDEFTYQAEAQGLTFRVVLCGLSIYSDPRLLEQMIRNLLSNALKYTKRGGVLLGCRRREGMLRIEIWDTGVGIPEKELQAIFEEYHQLDNAARERSRGLGLGLSIVQRQGDLLGHRVSVRSRLGRGSVFGIEVMLPPGETGPKLESPRHGMDDRIVETVRHTGAILVVEDDSEVRELLEIFLKDEGHHTATVPDGVSALALADRGMVRPDLILADYNLPNGLNGVQLTARLREKLHREIPAIILTGDISADTLRDIALHNCVHLNKPMKVKELTQVIQRLLAMPYSVPTAPAPHSAATASGLSQAVIFVVDDDSHVRDAIRDVLEEDGRTVKDYGTCEAFLEAYRPGGEACLLIDAYLPGMSGLQLLQWLSKAGDRLPAIMITGNSDVPMAVQAMKAGASDFIEKPVGRDELLASVERALEQSRDSSKLLAWRETAANHIAGLTPRQREIMELVLAGHPSKYIAANLGISQRTVESHRASIMEKTGSKSLPALARLALAAGWKGVDAPLAKQDLQSRPRGK